MWAQANARGGFGRRGRRHRRGWVVPLAVVISTALATGPVGSAAAEAAQRHQAAAAVSAAAPGVVHGATPAAASAPRVVPSSRPASSPAARVSAAPTADLPRNYEVDANGQLALPMPYLAASPTLTPRDDGSASLSFSIHYDVWIPLGDTSGRPDEAVLTVMVASTMNVNGPLKNSPTFVKVLVDGQLDQESQIRDYSIDLPADAVAFLKDKGYDPTLSPTALADAAVTGGSGKAGDPDSPAPPGGPSPEKLAAQRAALQYLEINVSHVRDFKWVDGNFDWSQSRAWTGTDGPVTESITDSSTFTVVNNTDQYGQTSSVDGVADQGGTNEFQGAGTDSTLGVPIVLAGQPVECIGQGDGSNPTGFQLTNGMDIALDLLPGQVPVGASITHQVNADDSLSSQTLSGAQDLVTGTVQVLASVASTTTPGLKSAWQSFALLAEDITEFGSITTVVLAIPFKAIGQLVRSIVTIATDSCADYSNIFNLTAAEPSGATAGYSWADQTDGLFDVYASSTYGTSMVFDDNVGVSQSTGIFSVGTSAGAVSVHPWLTQVAETGCGSSAHGLVNNTGSCGSSGNNVVAVTWSLNDPCPQGTFADCQVYPTDTSEFPPVTIPGSDLCGPDNDLCPTLAAPIPDGSDVTSPFYLAGTIDDSYTVLREWNPDDDQVNAMAAGAVSTPGLGGDLFLGWQSGRLTLGKPQQNGDIDDSTIVTFPTAVRSMVMAAGALWVGLENGQLFKVDAGPDALTSQLVLTSSAGSIEHLTTDGRYLYWAQGKLVSSYDTTTGAPGTSQENAATVDSLAVGPADLVVGTQQGTITSCPLGQQQICTAEPLVTGLTSAVLSIAMSGNVGYAGLQDGSLVRFDLVSSGGPWVLQGPGLKDSVTAGVTIVDGVLYYGGCYGTPNPITGDMLGVVAVPAAPAYDAYQPFTPAPDDGTNNCSNVSATDGSTYKGFQPTQYALASAQPQPGFPSILYVAFTIDSGSFVYALQNNLPPTTDLCYAQTSPAAGGSCPKYESTSIQQNVGSVPPPVGSLAALPGEPSSASFGGAAACQGEVSAVPTSGPDGSPGWEITVPTPGEGSEICQTTLAWNLNNVGTLPYWWWSGNLLPTAGSTAPVALAVTSGFGPPAYDGSTPWNEFLVAATLLSTDGSLRGTGSGPGPVRAGEALPLVELPATGVHVTAPLSSTDWPIATMLTIVVEVKEGYGSSFVITDDTLALAGGPPVPTPLPGTTHCPAASSLAPPAGSQIYPLDDPGSVVGDVGGGERNGLAWNTTQFDTGTGPIASCPDSGGLGLDGTSYVSTPDAAAQATAGPSGTVVAWFQGGAEQNGDPRIVANDHPDQTSAGLQLFLDQGGQSGAFQVGLGTGFANASWTSPTTLTDGTWHQYVGTWSDGVISVYVDGRLAGSSAYTGAPEVGGYPLSFGYDPQYQGDFFTGSIAQVAVLPVALTADQVAQSYALGGQG